VQGADLGAEHLPVARRVMPEHGGRDHTVLVVPHVAGLDLGVLSRLGRANDVDVRLLARVEALIREGGVRAVPGSCLQISQDVGIVAERPAVLAEDDAAKLTKREERQVVDRRGVHLSVREVELLPRRRRLRAGARREEQCGTEPNTSATPADNH